MLTIREVKAADTWPLRQTVMWPEKPLAYVQLPEDATGRHYGLYKEKKLVAVVSVFESDGDMQFRKFATLVEEQGQGYGSLLLQHILREAAAKGIRRVWCNARSDKSSFYEKFGLRKTDVIFQKGGKGYIIMERNF